jgi:alanine or glycine:cation symporter, AGCS family
MGAGVFVVTLMWGVRRGSVSNEAGQGSAPIAHAAAKTDEPVSEGVVALLEPLIDTIVICSMTGLVIIMTNSHIGALPDRDHARRGRHHLHGARRGEPVRLRRTARADRHRRRAARGRGHRRASGLVA